VFIETICELSRINKECTKFVYEELAFCDNHYHLDIQTQLLRIRGWFNDKPEYRNIIPFKNIYIDID
jgi:hypothetical protein